MYDEELEALSGAVLWHALILYVTLLFCVISCRHIRELLLYVSLPLLIAATMKLTIGSDITRCPIIDRSLSQQYHYSEQT